MSNSKSKKVDSPSRTVWRTQMTKGIYTPHRVSRITCIVNHLLSERVSSFLQKIDVLAYSESSRSVRSHIRPRYWGLPGEIVSLESASANIFRFTVPRENAENVMKALIHDCELYLPGHGTIFSQDLMEFSKDEPNINVEELNKANLNIKGATMLNKLAYVICVLSVPGSAEQLAKVALDLGICVPFITVGTGNDIRDQLGLIRITISAEKEIVHLVMPEQDSGSIIKLLMEQGRLDRPGRGFIYQTPVSTGLLDARLKIGRQKSAASLEQIIAAIDQLKSGTEWRKRLDANEVVTKISKSMMPQDNCEVSIISDEERIDELREACLKVGATGAITTRIVPQTDEETVNTMIRSAVSVPADLTDSVVDQLLEVSTIKTSDTDRVQILDSPAAYAHSL